MGRVIIKLAGQINSISAQGLERRIHRLLAAQPHDGVTLDAAKLLGISGAGLRVIARLNETERDLVIRNVSPEVWEMLRSAGITDSMEVRKKGQS